MPAFSGDFLSLSHLETDNDICTAAELRPSTYCPLYTKEREGIYSIVTQRATNCIMNILVHLQTCHIKNKHQPDFSDDK